LQHIFRVTGDPYFLDRNERIQYNALPGTITPTSWAHQYLQQANEINAMWGLTDHVWQVCAREGVVCPWSGVGGGRCVPGQCGVLGWSGGGGVHIRMLRVVLFVCPSLILHSTPPTHQPPPQLQPPPPPLTTPTRIYTMWGITNIHARGHVWQTDGSDSTGFGVEPNFGCCTANMQQGWPKAVNNLLLSSADGSTLLLAMMAPFTASVRCAQHLFTSGSQTAGWG
jgi:hypothetical protein